MYTSSTNNLFMNQSLKVGHKKGVLSDPYKLRQSIALDFLPHHHHNTNISNVLVTNNSVLSIIIQKEQIA